MHTQNQPAPTQPASTICLFWNLNLNSWMQKRSLCCQPMASLWSVVLTGGTHLAGPLQEHFCGSRAAGSTWKSLVWLRAAKQAILWLCSSWGLTVLPAVWMLTPWKYPQSWSLGLTDVVNPTSHHSHIQGIFTRLWQRGGFIMIRDALLQFMPFSCLQPRTDGRVMNPNAVTCRNYFRRSGWKFG